MALVDRLKEYSASRPTQQAANAAKQQGLRALQPVEADAPDRLAQAPQGLRRPTYTNAAGNSFSDRRSGLLPAGGPRSLSDARTGLPTADLVPGLGAPAQQNQRQGLAGLAQRPQQTPSYASGLNLGTTPQGEQLQQPEGLARLYSPQRGLSVINSNTPEQQKRLADTVAGIDSQRHQQELAHISQIEAMDGRLPPSMLARRDQLEGLVGAHRQSVTADAAQQQQVGLQQQDRDIQRQQFDANQRQQQITNNINQQRADAATTQAQTGLLSAQNKPKTLSIEDEARLKEQGRLAARFDNEERGKRVDLQRNTADMLGKLDVLERVADAGGPFAKSLQYADRIGSMVGASSGDYARQVAELESVSASFTGALTSTLPGPLTEKELKFLSAQTPGTDKTYAENLALIQNQRNFAIAKLQAAGIDTSPNGIEPLSYEERFAVASQIDEDISEENIQDLINTYDVTREEALRELGY